MQGSLESPPIVVRGSRQRGAWLFCGSAALVAMGAVGQLAGHYDSGLAFSYAFFALCGGVGLWTLIAPPRLEIGPSGLSQKVLWRTFKFAWTDIYDFRPVAIGFGNRRVGFDYLTPRPGRSGIRALNTAIAGVGGALAPGWEVDSETLAGMLNGARNHWVGVDLPPSSAASATGSRSILAGLGDSRLDRKTFLVASAALIALSIGVSLIPATPAGLGSAFSLLFIRLYAGRLHDLGRSGWWQLPLYAAQFALIIGLIEVGGVSASLAGGAAFLIQLGFTVALGALAGQARENRFGPPPGHPSAARQAEVFR